VIARGHRVQNDDQEEQADPEILVSPPGKVGFASFLKSRAHKKLFGMEHDGEVHVFQAKDNVVLLLVRRPLSPFLLFSICKFRGSVSFDGIPGSSIFHT
jgi:hypothetical protein